MAQHSLAVCWAVDGGRWVAASADTTFSPVSTSPVPEDLGEGCVHKVAIQALLLNQPLPSRCPQEPQQALFPTLPSSSLLAPQSSLPRGTGTSRASADRGQEGR